MNVNAARERARAHLTKPVAWYGESKLMADDVLALADALDAHREALQMARHDALLLSGEWHNERHSESFTEDCVICVIDAALAAIADPEPA